MPKFYLIPLEDVETDPAQILTLSQSTIDLCKHALIPAENRELWRDDLQELDDPTWETAEDFLTKAYLELDGMYTPPPSQGPPVYVENGTLQSSDNGVHTITPEDMGFWWFVKVHINHDGNQFLSNDDHELTTDADDYIPEDEGGVTYIYDQGYNLVYNGAHVTEYCGGSIVEFASFAQAFTAYVTVGEVCP